MNPRLRADAPDSRDHQRGPTASVAPGVSTQCRTHALDYVDGSTNCGGSGRFVDTFPPFLEGRVARETFAGDVAEINETVAAELKPWARLRPVGVALSLLGFCLLIVGFTARPGETQTLGYVGIACSIIGFAATGRINHAHATSMARLMGVLIPARLNAMSQRYGVALNLEQDTQVAQTVRGRRRARVFRTYKIVISDEIATGHVLDVEAPPVVAGAVVGAGPPPTAQVLAIGAPPAFCTNCGAGLARAGRFCGSCGYAVKSG